MTEVKKLSLRWMGRRKEALLTAITTLGAAGLLIQQVSHLLSKTVALLTATLP